MAQHWSVLISILSSSLISISSRSMIPRPLSSTRKDKIFSSGQNLEFIDQDFEQTGISVGAILDDLEQPFVCLFKILNTNKVVLHQVGAEQPVRPHDNRSEF